MWWKPGMSLHAANAAWELVVELRTGLPELKAAWEIGDDRTAGKCLDRMIARVQKVEPHLRVRWPHLVDEITAAAEGLRSNAANPLAWRSLVEIADELEEAIGSEVPSSVRDELDR